MSYNAQRLKTIASFEELLDYLSRELEWPIEDFEFEKLTFKYRLGKRSAVYGSKWPGTIAIGMNRSREELLSSTAFPANRYDGIGFGHFFA